MPTLTWERDLNLAPLYGTYAHFNMGERFEPCTSLCKNKDFTNWSRGNPSPRTMAKLQFPKKVVTIYIGKTRTSSEGSDFLDWLEVPRALEAILSELSAR